MPAILTRSSGLRYRGSTASFSQIYTKMIQKDEIVNHTAVVSLQNSGFFFDRFDGKTKGLLARCIVLITNEIDKVFASLVERVRYAFHVFNRDIPYADQKIDDAVSSIQKALKTASEQRTSQVQKAIKQWQASVQKRKSFPYFNETKVNEDLKLVLRNVTIEEHSTAKNLVIKNFIYLWAIGSLENVDEFYKQYEDIKKEDAIGAHTILSNLYVNLGTHDLTDEQKSLFDLFDALNGHATEQTSITERYVVATLPKPEPLENLLGEEVEQRTVNIDLPDIDATGYMGSNDSEGSFDEEPSTPSSLFTAFQSILPSQSAFEEAERSTEYYGSMTDMPVVALSQAPDVAAEEDPIEEQIKAFASLTIRAVSSWFTFNEQTATETDDVQVI